MSSDKNRSLEKRMIMEVSIRGFKTDDIEEVIDIWNEVVDEGNAFPQKNTLLALEGLEFFQSQSFTGVAVDEGGTIVGVYILHPNNVGRCGHICNASYAIRSDVRGKQIGEAMVKHSMEKAKELGFRILQFNAVVSSNQAALHLYEKLGFTKVGVIPGGFCKKDGTYEDIIPHYHLL